MENPEEWLTKWIDGELEGEELTAFQARLKSHPEWLEEKESARKLGLLLREGLETGEEIPYPDFFNYSVAKQIEEIDGPPAPVSPARRPLWRRRWLNWSIGWTASGVAALAALAVSAYLLVTANGNGNRSDVLSTYTPDPSIEARVVYSEKAHATVLMLDGLQEIPAEHDVRATPATVAFLDDLYR